MKGKIKTTLLITVLLLSTIVGLATPTVLAATSISPKYVFEENDAGTEVTVGWSADRAVLGEYSAKLVLSGSAVGGDYAYIRVYPDNPTIALSDLDTDPAAYIPTFSYWLATGHAVDHPDLELYFSDGGLGWAEISVFPTGTYVWDKTANQWNLADGLDGGVFAVVYGEDSLGNAFSRDLGSDPLSAVIDYVLTQVTDPGDWVLTRVTPQIGWGQTDIEAYIDNVVIGDDTYDLEPQNLIVGESYDISWATNYASEDVNLLYTQEDQPDIDVTSATSASGVVNFYNVMPNSAGNWTLSDLTDTLPTPAMNEDGLVKMSMTPATGHEITAYFLVQPVEDLDIVVSPSSVDVESGTTVLSVTVTSDGEPVEDAYVNVEFWDDEAKHIDTDDTALLRGYTIQTLSSGVAMFDVEVPEVAGTIFVIAGKDIEPLITDPDGKYFEHWGYKTIPVDSAVGIETVVSPSTFVEGVSHDLIITLDELITGALSDADAGDAVTITIAGDGISTGAVTATSGITATAYILDDGTKTAANSGAEWVATISGKDTINLIGEADADTIVITITDFASAADVDVTVAAVSDIGGVAGNSIDITDADGLEDYVAATKNIPVETAETGAVYFVDLQESIEAAKEKTISFTVSYTHNSDTDPCDAWVVKLEYPTGHVYTGVTGGDGSFSKAITADEQGVVAITVSKTILTVPYLGTAEVPIKGFLISTDKLSFTVLEENTIAITVMNGTTPVNNAKVILSTSEPDTLTSFEDNVIDGAVDYVEFGQYIFHEVESSVVATITATASKLVESVDVDYAQLTMKAVNHVLDVSPSITELTALVDNEFTVYVTEEGEPILDAVFELNLTELSYEAIPAEEDGYYDVTIDYDVLPEDVNAVKIDVVNDVMTKTGSFTLPVGLPVYVHSEEFYLTAGIDCEGNFTVMSADGEDIILVELATEEDVTKVHALLNITTFTTDDMVFENEYLWFKLLEGKSCDELEKIPALEITAETATETSPESSVVAVLPIYNPIVSNSTGSGFPITYTAYVGQSGNFYIKIQEAGGEPVEDAEIKIVGTLTSGVTDSDGETTITWTPPSTGTYDLRLNEVLDIGTIKVESYVAPKLVVDYSPDIVYQDDVVTVTVTADDVPVAGATVSIVDPNGDIYYKLTKTLGTCTFTADLVDEWDIFAEATGYEASDTVTITVLELAPVTDISLSVGWNLISLPLIPYDSSIESVLAGVEGIESVWTYDAGTWYTYSPGAPSDLTDMVDGEGYWISMTASATLTVEGTEMPEDPFDPLPAYPVVEGWNLVGFKSTSAKTVSEYLLGVDYVRVYEYVDGYNSLSATDYMMPGRGYWVAVSEAGTIYP